MRYAGFWVRLWAGLLDFLVFIPMLAIYAWVLSRSYAGSLLTVIPYFLAYALYCIFFLAKCGQTPGKMFMRIKVTRLDGSRITLRDAALRHSVDFVFALASGIGMFIAIERTSPSALIQAHGFALRSQMLVLSMPPWADIANALSNLWIWSEMIVLLFNKKRRAIHDFIASTVVIHVEQKEVSQGVAGEASQTR